MASLNIPSLFDSRLDVEYLSYVYPISVTGKQQKAHQDPVTTFMFIEFWMESLAAVVVSNLNANNIIEY